MAGRRRTARVIALQALFELDTVGHEAVDCVSRLAKEASAAKEITAYALELVNGVIENQKRINEIRAKPAVDFNDPKMVRLQRRQDALQKTKDGLADTVSLFATTINAIFDITGSYNLAFIIFIGLFAVSSVLMWVCWPPKAVRYARPEDLNQTP